MKSSYHNMAKAIPVLLLAACIDNRNDFSGASTSTEEAANTTLPAPENLSATATGSEVNLTWDAVDGATAYNVYIYDQSGYIQSDYSPTNLGATSASASTRVSVTSHLVSSLEYEVDYYFGVTAVAGDLESGKSNEVGVRPLQSLSNSTPSVQLLDISANAAEVVTLSAEVSDPDGNDISYLWKQTSGDSVDISDSDQAESYFTAPIADAPMELGFALTVSDDYGASNSKSATVSVSDNIAPQVDAGADQSVSAGALVDLLGSASDSDGGIAEVTWQLSSGSGVILSSTSTLDTSFVAPSSSSELTLVFQLSVTDDRGASASDTVTVTVGIDQEATIDSAISTSVPENTSGIVYTVSATSSEDEVLSYDFSGADIDDFTIDFDDGTIAFSNPPDYENPADSDGDNVYQLNFEVSDSVNTLKQALSIDVTDLDEFDVVAPGDDDAAANEIAENSDTGTLVGLTASASDADGTNNTISYSFAGSSLTSPDGLFDIDASTGVVSYNGSGSLDYETGATSYSLDIYAHSSDGSSASASFSVNIIDVNEAPVFASTSDSANALENSTDVFYSASATDEDAGASVSYFLASSGADNYLFNLDNTSGELQFKAAPDYETFLDSNSDGIYQVIISASDGSLSSENDLELAVSVSNVNEAPTITSATSASTPENTESTTTIYTASATDPENDTLTYALSGTDADDFNIDPNSGAISFANTPDHETPTDADTNNVYQVTLEVSDGNANSASQELTISVTNVNEIPLITSSANASVPENTTTTIYTASATDPEDDTLTYALSGTDTDDFIIDPSSGAISFVDTPNYEIPTDDNSNNVYQVTLEVSDDNDNNTSLVLTIKVTNVNEAPTFTSATSASVPENTTTTIYTASATDPENDTLTYALSGTDKDEFIIDSSSGAISFANTPDHETPTDANNDNDYQIILEVSDGNGNSASQELTITVTDGNEIPTITSATSASILENTSGTIYTASATDPEDDTLTYALSSTDKDDFTIDSSSGTISFTINPDYENPADADTDNVYQVTLEVSDGSNTVTQELTFTVTDSNEFSVSTPTDADGTPNQISEDAVAGTAVGITASASDADGTNNTVSYGFTNDNLITTAESLFSVASDTGIVTLTHSNVLDYESETSYKLVIEATSSDGSSATSTFTIDLTDVNEHHVGFSMLSPDADSSPNQISEDAAAGTAVGITASASDYDGTNNTINYSFDNDSQTSADNLFSIASDTGIVTLAASNSLDYETATSHDIVAKATSSDGSTDTETFTVAVTDIDEFDVTTPTDSDSDTNQIAENASSGATVGITASASDGDGTNNTVSYSFTNDSQTSADNLFSIASDTGIVTLAAGASLDYETATSHELAIKATSSDGSTDSETFTVAVTDVDEFDVTTPTDSDSDANQITENASSGATVGITASASDGDGTNNTVSYSFDNDLLTSGFFSIDASSGVVTLTNSNSLDYETGTSHDIIIKSSSSDGSTDSETFTVAVTDVDEFDVSSPTDSDSDANQIAENASSGATVGITASASDGDGTNNTVSYSFDNDLLTSGFFSIDASSGVVTLTNSNSLDYETGTSHDIVIKATSTDGSTATSSTLIISVIDHDEFDVSTPTDSDSDANQITENASSGATVGITASASDGDGTNNTISYSFDNDSQTSDDNLFSIASDTGIVTLTNSNSLDYEAATSHDIVIKATSIDGSAATSSTLTINVIDHDEFDVSPPTDSDSDANQIAENASSGATVGITASASDGDGTNNTVSYSFANDSQTSGFFSIDASSGVVTLTNSNSLDYEIATSHDIIIKSSSSDGSTDSETFTVAVTDVDEFDVSTPTDSDSDANQIAENASSGATVGITATASDGDGTNSTVSYSFDNDLLTSSFFSIDASSGVVTLTNSNSLDYETATNHQLVVKAASSDGSTATATFTINVTDVNEHDVVFATEPDADSSPNQIAEDAAAGTAVGITATASDADDTAIVSYGFTNGNQTSDDNLFSIDPNSGIVKLLYSNSLDYETATSHDIAVKATSSDGSSTTRTFTIDVTDVNDNTPIITPSQSFDIDEASANGTSLGTVAFSDADSEAVNTFTWGITGGNTNSAFAINSDTGEVTVNTSSELDTETTPSYSLSITVSDGATTSSAETVTINVNDLNDNAPVITASQSFSVDENSANATSVGTVMVTDADTTATTYQDWTITAGNTNNAFAINDSTGELSVADASQLDYESGAILYTLSLTVSDGATTSSAETVTININDLNDNLPIIAASQSFSVDENSANATSVGTVMATDADATATTYQDWTITGGNTNNAFAINDSTGELTVNTSSELDTETTPSYTLTLTVSDGVNTSSAETVTISINDLNDNTPIITPSQSFDIDEASANGTSLGTVVATDADATATTYQDWSITGGNTNNAFAIDPSSGELTVNTSSELDYESGTILYTLSLTVSDGATTSSAETVTINILDVSEHDAAPNAAYLGLPDNYINITFTPESGVSYQLHRSFVEGCTSSSCDAEGYQLFASPNSSGTADTMTFSQTHYYSLVGDNSTTFTTSINDSDGAKLAALVAAQSLSTEYDLANDWVNISSTDSNNVIYTLYMAGEPFAAGGCEDSELDNIGSLCADGSSLSDGSMHSATEVINWSARRYYRLDISDGYQVVHSLESNASVIDPVVLNASNASLTIDITWSALNSSKLAEYTVYLSDDSAATTASTATWSSLSNPQIISGNSGELYSLVPILSQYYVAITATNTESETTPLSKVYLVNNIVTGDPDPSTWHEIIADTDDSPAHWEGRSTHGSLVFQDKMWLIGGRTANEAHIAEVWSSTDGYNWTEVNPSAAFGARREFVSMVHDGKMWVLGGEIEGYVLANDVWYSSDGANWHEATEAASWHARDYFGGVSFASGATGSDEMWVLGHYTGDPRGIPGVEDHHYSTDGSTWSSVSVSGLPPSSFFPAITFNNAILIVGGYFYTNSAWSNSNTIYSSTDGVNWTELSVSGSIWDARRIHTTLVYDDKLWVLAGDSGYNRDDYWYSSDGTQWHEATASGSKWEARSVHTSVNYAGRMWMLGGYGSTGDKQLNDVWASGLEITSFSFNPVTTN